MTKKNVELAIYVSAILLAVGVFLPLTSLPIIGDVTYTSIAQIESYVVIFFAVTAPVFISIKSHRLLLVSVIGAWVTLLFPAIESLLTPKDTSLLGKLGDKASSVMQEFAADLFLNIVEFSWGGFIFLLGLLLFTVFGIMRALQKK